MSKFAFMGYLNVVIITEIWELFEYCFICLFEFWMVYEFIFYHYYSPTV
ncbi:MAG: hypothetical protein LBM96_06765 [Methanobrevibacter sp.]|nr:hypothetical protein [Candidatus Methanoflexus mossambicus]